MKILKRLLNYTKSRSLLLLLVACIATSSLTAALYAKYVTDVDKDVEINIVSDGKVQIEVVESEGTYTIRHTANSKIPAYIRFTVVANWKSTTGDDLWYLSPESVTITTPCAQKVGEYYYGVVEGKAEIAVGTVLSGITVTTTQTAPDGYELDVRILAEAIQCMPTSVVKSAWGVTFNGTTWSKTS